MANRKAAILPYYPRIFDVIADKIFATLTIERERLKAWNLPKQKPNQNRNSSSPGNWASSQADFLGTVHIHRLLFFEWLHWWQTLKMASWFKRRKILFEFIYADNKHRSVSVSHTALLDTKYQQLPQDTTSNSYFKISCALWGQGEQCNSDSQTFIFALKRLC